MATDEHEKTHALEPLEKARNVSKALAEAARKARSVARRRGSHGGSGFKARRGARLIQVARWLTFILFVVIPGAAIATYYGFIASDQWVAEARFTVGTSQMPQLDKIGSVTGLLAASIVQDTQVVVNYIGSRAAVEAVKASLDLDRIYGDPSIDWHSRFDAAGSVEKFVRYWGDMHSLSISLPSGYVSFRVRAFSPEDAVRVAKAFVAASEALVNSLNTRAFADTMRTAEAELQRASDRLSAARIAVEKARNTEGMLDAANAAESLTSLITETRSGLIKMQQEYDAQSKVVSRNSPQLRVLKDRIDVTGRQIADLESKLTSTKTVATDDATIASSMSRFAELDLEKQIAERLYAGAIASVELARIVADDQRMYLNQFVEPALPEQPQYPRRLLNSLLAIGGLLIVWAVAWGLGLLVRDYMA